MLNEHYDNIMLLTNIACVVFTAYKDESNIIIVSNAKPHHIT